ncbi:MAG: hypothetical protein KDI30_10890, partial [Pseudomonadales bacterium]|nr:hypothetical protein [Pseudomonadales bacterium]
SSVEPVEPTAVGSAGDVYGPVQSNETLWAIAQKTLPEQGMSIQQAMLAIQRLNPDAFINGNINLLKKGVVLRLPTAADIRATTAREAISEVALQNAEWRGASAQIDASSTAKKMEPAGLDESDRLTLVAPGAEEDGVFGSGLGDEESVDLTEGDDFVSGDISADGVDVEEGLEAGSVQDAAMLEEMDRIARENEALKSDLGKLEEQLSTVDEILDVQNADMDAIEESIKQLASEKAVEKPRKVESADVPATDESDPIDFYLVFKILMVFVVVIGIFVFYSRKRAASTRESDVELDWEEPVQETEVEEAVEEVVSAQPPVKEEKKPVVAEPETEDAIGEADIYISFGNFEKAEALLLSAIAAEPARNDLRLKLLEVLVETRDLAKFDQQLAEIRSSQDANAVARAEALRSKIAGDEATVEDSLDIDLGLDAETKPLEEEAFVESTTPETSLEDEFDIDLSLDADESSASDLSPALQDEVVEEGAAQEDEFDLDLSSDFMDSENSVESVQTEAEVAPSADELVDEFIEEALEEQGVTEDQIVEEAAEMIEEPSEIVEEVEQAQPPVAQEEEAELLDEDETATKLELAKAYMDMGDTEGAKDILEEVLEEGSAAQKEEAQSLMNELG